MLKNAPSEKPVITHYPPSYETNLDDNINNEAQRLCGPVISESAIDDEIIIMMFSSTERGNAATDIPKFAPVIAAGMFYSQVSIFSLNPMIFIIVFFTLKVSLHPLQNF